MINIFQQLFNISGENTYYLRALHDLENIDLNYYYKLFNIIDDPAQITILLSSESWREHLIAYMLIMTNKTNFFTEELKECFSRGSYISPQLAVAFALQTRKEGLRYFLDCLESSRISSKSIGALMAVLPTCWGFKLSISDLNIDLDDFKIGYLMASHHLTFWQKNGWECTPH
jgi:hypothetical protein